MTQTTNGETRYGKVLMLSGKPVERFMIEEYDEQGTLIKVIGDSMLWRAGQTFRAMEKKGANIAGYVWDEDVQDFVESDDIRAEGVKREENARRLAAERAGKPVDAVKKATVAAFDDDAFRKVRSIGEFIVELAKTGKKEAMTDEATLHAVLRCVELFDLLGLPEQFVRNAIRQLYTERKEEHAPTA